MKYPLNALVVSNLTSLDNPCIHPFPPGPLTVPCGSSCQRWIIVVFRIPVLTCLSAPTPISCRRTCSCGICLQRGHLWDPVFFYRRVHKDWPRRVEQWIYLCATPQEHRQALKTRISIWSSRNVDRNTAVAPKAMVLGGTSLKSLGNRRPNLVGPPYQYSMISAFRAGWSKLFVRP